MTTSKSLPRRIITLVLTVSCGLLVPITAATTASARVPQTISVPINCSSSGTAPSTVQTVRVARGDTVIFSNGGGTCNYGFANDNMTGLWDAVSPFVSPFANANLQGFNPNNGNMTFKIKSNASFYGPGGVLYWTFVVANQGGSPNYGKRFNMVVYGPAITSIVPNYGSTAGGTSIAINGSGFTTGSTVTVGGSLCTSVVFVSATKITCVTPANSVGAKDVVVTPGSPDDPGGNPATLTGGYTYGPGAIAATSTGGTATSTYSGSSGIFNLVATPASGYAFSGWSCTAAQIPSASTASTTITPRADTTCTASFSTYTVTASAGTGGTATATAATAGKWNLLATPAAGYRFTSWSCTPTQSPVSATTASTSIVPLGDRACTASFSTYTVTASAGTGGTATSTYSGSNGVWRLAATPNSGQIFNQWSCTPSQSPDSVASASTTITPAGGNRACAASFSAAPAYTVTSGTSSNGNSTAIYSGSGGVWNLVATPASGYTFTSWACDNSQSPASTLSATTTVTLTASSTCTATFTTSSSTTYSVIAGTSEGGTVTSTPTGSGGVWNLVATPASGYAFLAWSCTAAQSPLSASTASTTITPTADTTCTANFDAVTVTGAANPTAGGTVTSTPTGSGGVWNLVATPASGYAFSAWSCTAAQIPSASTASTTITPTADTTCTADFDAVTVTGAANPTAGGTVTATPTGSGGVWEINAAPNSDYRFVRWSCSLGGLPLDIHDPSTTITPSVDSTCTANFAVLGSYLVTADKTPSIGGTVSASDIDGDGTWDLVATAASGYTFSSWSCSGATAPDSTTAASTTVVPTADITCTATFTVVSNSSGPRNTTVTVPSMTPPVIKAAKIENSKIIKIAENRNQLSKVNSQISIQVITGVVVSSVVINGKSTAESANSGTIRLPVLIGPKDQVSVTVTKDGQEVSVPVAYVPKPVALGNVNFDLNSSKLTAQSKEVLKKAAQSVIDRGFTNIDLSGYADIQGGPNFDNKSLSEERAKVVSEYMKSLLPNELGIKIITKANGADGLISKSKSQNAHAVNRRVEIVVK